MTDQPQKPREFWINPDVKGEVSDAIYRTRPNDYSDLTHVIEHSALEASEERADIAENAMIEIERQNVELHEENSELKRKLEETRAFIESISIRELDLQNCIKRVDVLNSTKIGAES